jgi:hypothetical protein
MKNIPEIIDSAILVVCTRISHALQRAVGLTNYFIAKVGVGISALTLFADITNYFHQFLSDKSSLSYVMLLLFILYTLVYRSLACAKAEDYLWSGKVLKPSEILIFKNRFVRLLWLVFLTCDVCLLPYRLHKYPLIDIFDKSGFSIGLFIFYYFIAVDPLPPGTSKVKEFFSLKKQAVAVQDNA